MPTPVAHLMRVADSLLVQYSKRFTDEQIVLLEEAKWEVWKILIGYSQRSNWFVKRGTAFDITTGDDEYALPSDCYQLRKLVPVSEADKHFWFHNESEQDDEFQQMERMPSRHALEIPYVVIGEEPGTLILASTPERTVSVRPWYVYKPTAWAVKGDPIDQMPRSTWLPIARYAATIYRLGAGNPAWGDFRAVWADEINRMVNTDTRVQNGPKVVHGYFEDS
jgi:hypothetical protein